MTHKLNTEIVVIIVFTTGVDGGTTRYLESRGSAKLFGAFRIDGKSSEDSEKVYIQK